MPRAAGSRTKTRHPGIYKLAAGGYEYVWRNAHGRQQSATVDSMAVALREKPKAEDLARRGHDHDETLTLEAYALDWVERYQGRTNRGFRESSRDAYRRELTAHVLPFFGERQKITTVTPRLVSSFVSHLVAKPAKPLNAIESRRPDPSEPRATLSDDSIRRIMAPLKACLADAVQEGVIPSNPTSGVRLPRRPKIEEDEDAPVKALTEAELKAVLLCAPEEHRTLLEFLALTGLRISECLGVAKRHLVLSGDRPRVKVRRAWVKGEYNPPKSRFGKRDVPLSAAMVRALRRRVAGMGPDDLVFGDPEGNPWDVSTLRRRSIEIAGPEAGVPWAGFHTLRHTCATRLFAAGRNAVQVSRWLGHHSAAFTLERYVHLLNDDLGGPLELPAPAGALGGDSMGTARFPETAGDAAASDPRILSV